jgi:hypothetical protein
VAEDDERAKEWGPDGPPTEVRVASFVDALDEQTAPHDMRDEPGFAAGREVGYAEGRRAGVLEGRADARAEDFRAGVEAFAVALETYLQQNDVPGWAGIVAGVRKLVRRGA